MLALPNRAPGGLKLAHRAILLLNLTSWQNSNGGTDDLDGKRSDRGRVDNPVAPIRECN